MLNEPNRAKAEEKPLFPISVEGKFGYVDFTGRVIIKPQFLNADFFSEGLARVEVAGTTQEGRAFDRTYQGFIDPKGNFAIPPQPPRGVRDMEEYRKCGTYTFYDFHNGLARFLVGDGTGVFGFIDRKGNVVIKPKFYAASDFSEGLAFANLRVKPFMESLVPKSAGEQKTTGFINTQGDFVIENNSIWHSHRFIDGLAVVFINPVDAAENCGLIDRREKFVIPPSDVYLGDPISGAIRAVKDGEVGLLDYDGKIIVAFGKYDQITEPEVGSIFVAEAGGKTYLLDSSGKQLAAVVEKGEIGRFHNDLATIKRDGRVGYIDASGTIKIPLRFDYAKPFKSGLAWVRWGKTMGYINRQGKVVWKTDRWN